VHRLAHVIDSKGRHAASHHGFHLHPRLVITATGGGDLDVPAFRVQCKIDADEAEWQGVAKGDEFSAPFGGQHAGHACRVQDFALAPFVAAQEIECLGVHRHASAAYRYPLRGDLVRDVNHTHLTGLVQVAE